MSTAPYGDSPAADDRGLERILFASDLSAVDRPAFLLARHFKDRSGGELAVVHAVAKDTNPPAHPIHTRPAVEEGEGDELEYLIRSGRTDSVILETASELGATLIVLGTHARHGASRLWSGSVAESVLRSSECPVVILRKDAWGSEPIELVENPRILIAVDFSELNVAALRTGLAWAHYLDGLVTLIHVTPDIEPAGTPLADAPLRQAAWERLRGIHAPDLSQPLAWKLVRGRPTEEIPLFASESDQHLIVVGTHGRSGLRRAVYGSVAEAVIREADCPVLAVRG